MLCSPVMSAHRCGGPLILLAVGKAVATSLTTTSGASGGAFMPSLFMGAAVGTGFALLAGEIWPFPIESGALRRGWDGRHVRRSG